MSNVQFQHCFCYSNKILLLHLRHIVATEISLTSSNLWNCIVRFLFRTKKYNVQESTVQTISEKNLYFLSSIFLCETCFRRIMLRTKGVFRILGHISTSLAHKILERKFPGEETALENVAAKAGGGGDGGRR